MATVLVSFVGTGEYKTCRYRFRESDFETHLFPIALGHFFNDADRFAVLVTDEAQKARRKSDDLTYLDQLDRHQRTEGRVLPEKIRIRSGRNEDELWEIFESVVAILNEGDEVVFDITHAFRSLPVLSFLVIAFLRETKKVSLKAVLYGAFEAKFNDENGNEITPVFDLSPFVELLDWLAAAKQFTRTGNAAFLVELLNSKKEGNLARSIGELSDALLLMRPVPVMEISARLSKQIENPENRKRIRTKPFVELLESVGQSYLHLGLREPKKAKDDFVVRMMDLAEWYFDNGHYAYSIAAIREAIVSVVCRRLEKDLFKHKDHRDLAEFCLNQPKPETEPPTSDPTSVAWKDTGLPDEWKELWRNASDLRNDVLHMGFNENSRSPASAIDQNRRFLEQLKTLFSKL